MAGGNVVETLVLEMDARTVQLEAQLAKMEQRLAQLQQKGASTNEAVARSASNVGERYGIAAREIASVTDQIARTGEVAGREARQLIAHGSEMAFMFGTSGAIVGAIGIAGLAIVNIFTRARREMEETAAKFRTELAEIARAGDLNKLAGSGGLLQTLYSGDRFAGIEGKRAGESSDAYLLRQIGISGVQERIAALTKRRQAGIGPSGEVLESAAQVGAEIERLNKLLGDAADPNSPLGRYQTALSLLPQEARDAVLKQNAEIQKGLIDDQQKLLDQAREGLTRFTQTLADDQQANLDKFKRDVAQKYGNEIPAQISQYIAKWQEQIDLQPVLDMFDQAADDIAGSIDTALVQITETGSSRELNAMLDQLTAMADAIKAQMVGVDQTSAAYKDLELRLKRIKDLYDKIASGAKGAGNPATPGKDPKEDVRDATKLANEIERGARGAIQLAEAFGLVGAEASRALQAVADIAANIPVILQALDDTEGFKAFLKAGGGSAVLGVLGGAATLIGALFGDSPKDAERRRVYEENTKALRQLTLTVGLLGSDVSANDLARGRAILGRQYRVGAGTNKPRLNPDDADFLQQLASDLGLTFDGTIDSFIQLQRAIDEASGKIAKFSDTFEGVTTAMDFGHQIFGDKGPLADLQELLAKFGGAPGAKTYAPGIAGVLSAGDINTPEGRAAIRKAVEELAQQILAGTFDQSLTGGLTGAQFEQTLTEIIDYLNKIDEGGGSGGTGGYNVSRTITEVTGDRIAGLLTAANTFQERIALAVEALVGSIIGPIQAPALASIGAGAMVINIDANVTVDLSSGSAADASAATAIGHAAGDSAAGAFIKAVLRELQNPSSALLQAIDTSMNQRLRRRKRWNGDNKFPG